MTLMHEKYYSYINSPFYICPKFPCELNSLFIYFMIEWMNTLLCIHISIPDSYNSTSAQILSHLRGWWTRPGKNPPPASEFGWSFPHSHGTGNAFLGNPRWSCQGHFSPEHCVWPLPFPQLDIFGLTILFYTFLEAYGNLLVVKKYIIFHYIFNDTDNFFQSQKEIHYGIFYTAMDTNYY